jgi:hypothetical protein
MASRDAPMVRPGGAKLAGPGTPWLLGSIAAAIYFVLRLGTDYVWNDPVGLIPNPALAPPPPSFFALLRAVAPSQHYRPLSDYIATWGLIVTDRAGTTAWLAISAIVVGSVAAAMLVVAARLLEARLWALVATVLFICSPAFLTGSWVVLAGMQPMVPLIMCLGVLFYLRQREQRGVRRLFDIGGLALVMLLGPWYREYLGVISVLVIAEEARRWHRPTAVMALGLFGFVHGLFRMLLPKLFLDATIPVLPITSQLGAGTHPFERLDTLGQVQLGMATDFLVLFPPSLVLIAFAAFAFKGLRSGGRDFVAVLGLLAVAIAITGMSLTHFLPIASADLLIAAAFILFGWAFSPFLGLWIALTLLPFYKFFTEIVHLSYPMVPASIVVAAGLREAWSLVEARRWLAPLTAVLMTILVLGQTLNVYGVWHVMQKTSEGMREVAADLQHTVPRGAIVIGNVVHLANIDEYAHHWFAPYFSVRTGVDGPYADAPATVAKLISDHPGSVYLLDASQPYIPNQYLHHSHPLVRTHAVDWIDMGTLRSTTAFYPFVDPLDALVPRQFTPFVGAPDLVQDFYRGRALDGTPFMREVFVEYHLYRVTGEAVRTW